MAASERSATLFTNRLYDRLKTIALIVLPVIAMGYYLLGTIFNLSNTEEVLGAIVTIDGLLGGTLKAASNRYYKSGANFDGEVIVTPEDGGNKVTFALNAPPEDVVDLPGKHSMEYRIVRQGS
jgi:hypothetical protein